MIYESYDFPTDSCPQPCLIMQSRVATVRENSKCETRVFVVPLIWYQCRLSPWIRLELSDWSTLALCNLLRKNKYPCIDPISHMEVVRHALFCTLIVYRSERPLADLGWDAARQLLKRTIGCH